MPELPEVETMVRGIRPHLIGRAVRQVDVCANECKPISITPSIRRIQKRLVGQQVSAVRRLGKRAVLDVSDGSSLVIEPRMTGLLLMSDPPDFEHLRLILKVQTSGRLDSVWFWDRRGLGTVRLFDPGELQVAYGPEILGTDALEMTVEHWSQCCAKTRREIKVVLLDQKMVAGIGNIYASEILHQAGIHPSIRADSLRAEELARLAASTFNILSKAIECEGSTLGDGTYRTALNKKGQYQNEHRVYMREGQSCLTCLNGSIVRVVQAQRSTFFCSGCQPL